MDVGERREFVERKKTIVEADSKQLCSGMKRSTFQLRIGLHEIFPLDYPPSLIIYLM